MPALQKYRHPSRRWRKWLYAPLLLLVATLYISERRLVAYSESPYPVARTVPFSAARPSAQAGPGIDSYPLMLAFNKGETLSDALRDVGIGGAEAVEIVDQLSRWADPRRIRPDDQYSIEFTSDGQVDVFELEIARRGRVRVARAGGDWIGDWREFERSIEVRAIAGTLSGSLEGSIATAGGETNLAILMADVFQWDLDFTRDLRIGDGFRILYETVYLDGVWDGLGSILAVSYANGGRVLEAYRFGDDGAYYDADGRPIRKMFLRSPLRYSRVTSRFSHRRFHPILKRYRPHHGVDYGAPTGTPVRATANGTVVSAGWDRGGGKTVKVRHPNGYLTAYLHLSRYAKGVRSGRRVMQGDVVGYVGSTGLSTAPHLDYRVQRNGRWINPLSLKSVPADPVPHRRLPEFLAWRDDLRRSLIDGEPFDLTRLAETNGETRPEAQTTAASAASR
ncbi:MAG: peptidoglycan DD-metalloendopeptidase family protein [Thermoanaerobaculia bacterium]